MPKGKGYGSQTKSSHGKVSSVRSAPKVMGGKVGKGTKQMGNPHQAKRMI